MNDSLNFTPDLTSDYFVSVANNIKEKSIGCLGNLLTTYTFPNGLIMPAIAINAINNNDIYPPEGTVIGEGIEVVIYYPDVVLRRTISGYSRDYIWQVYLKQWNIKDSTLVASEIFIDSIEYQVKSCFRNRQLSLMNQPEICKIELLIGIEGRW